MASGLAEPSSPDSPGEKQRKSDQTGAIARHSKLVERLLSASGNLPEFIDVLLSTQAVVVAGTEAAAFLIEPGQEGAQLKLIKHARPDNSSPQLRAAAVQAFQQIVGECVNQTKDGALQVDTADGSPEPQFCLVTLLRNEGQIVAASAVVTRCRNRDRAHQRLVSMQLVAGYFELYNVKRNAEQSQVIAESHQSVLQFATAVAAATGFESAAMNLCNELASRSSAVRVALGWIKGEYVKVVAFSHTEEFDKKQEMVVELQKVMEECVDQEEPVHFDPGGNGSANVTRAAANYSRTQGGHGVLCLPLRHHAEIVGVVVLEFAPDAPISPQTLTSLSVAVDLLAPQLDDRYKNDRWLITKTGIAIRDLAEKIIGPQYMLAKTISVGVAALLIFVSVFSMMYHVRAPFEFEAVNKTTISSPIDGYIETVDVRPGARVHKGDVLLTFRTVELKKKLNEAIARAKKAEDDAFQAQDASEEDPSKQGEYEVHIQEERAAEADAQLFQLQIDESTIRAPADGIVLTGDLEDQINSFKKEGDELFTFQSGNDLRADLSVAENDIQEVVQYGHGGMLTTTSLPSVKFPFTIQRIDPEGQAKDGSNVFHVFVTVPDSGRHEEWRPGMQGEAKIDIQRRRLVWIWTHKFIDWLRLKSWTWL
ncbi:MAG TPA: HlyD family efflux transporter periplasmic adaptor subunit [Tepidisphaeraceae bacterium]|nr:HlyD family efflux transporter periplasmic adaptor subunit [Tepidisphaeraceae bacterium]